MRTYLLVLIAFVAFSEISTASVGMCRDVLKKKTAREIRLEKKGLKLFKTTSGREIVYKYTPPKHPGTQSLAIIHGLGHDMTKMQPIASLAESYGMGTVLVDLNAHGETLVNSLRANRVMSVDDYNYKSNVDDTYDLFRHLKLDNFSLVGHSMGGGISYALAGKILDTQPEHGMRLNHVFLLAPYVQRIDKYIRDAAAHGEFWMQKSLNSVNKVGANPAFVETIFDPIFELLWNLNKFPQAFQDYFLNFLGVQKVKDFVQDPIMDEVMRKQYREFFTTITMGEKNGKLTAYDKKMIEVKAEVTIQVTKGLRGLDYLDLYQTLPNVTVPTTIIAARNDRLVLIAQLKEFLLRLLSQGRDAELTVLEGDNIGHFFVQMFPELVHDVVLDRLTRPNAKPE